MLVDDHTMFREGLKFVLSMEEDFEIICEAGTGNEFLEIISRANPDVVLMDISLPDIDGIQISQIALEKYEGLKILALSSYGDEVYYYKMVKAGVLGFVHKKSDKSELITAIRTIYKGENYFSKDILHKIVVKVSNKGESSLVNSHFKLTKREKEILQFICQGYSNNEIAETLFISPKTVDNHRTNLLSKTGTRNSAHLVMFAIKHKIVEI